MTPGYFNATKLVPTIKGVKTLKPAHFLDNLQIIRIMDKLGKPPKVFKGRNGHTELPDEIRHLFVAWLELNAK